MSPRSDLDTLFALERQLRALPEVPYRNRHGHPCQHPASLFSQSLAKVFHSMRAVTDSIPLDNPLEVNLRDWRRTADAIEVMLTALASHKDNLNTILHIVSGQDGATNMRKTARLLDDMFEELVTRPLNQVKHHAHTIQARCAASRHSIVYGYFICGMREDGAMGASPRAHGKAGSGWSVGSTIRHVIGVLISSAVLLRTTRCLPPLEATPTLPEQNVSDVRAIITWLQAAPLFCFPNEKENGVPYLALESEHPIVRLKSLHRLKRIPRNGTFRFTVTWTVDSVTKSFSVL